MRARRDSERGVTLIELLIAVTLMGLLAGGILMSLRVGLNAMERSNDKLMMNRRVAGVRRIMSSQIENIVPVNGACPQGQSILPLKWTFFEGRPGSMRAVTSYSLTEAGRGYPRIVEYLVIPGENGVGVRLVMNERPYAGPWSLAALCTGVGAEPGGGGLGMIMPPVEASPASFVLADKLAYCRLSFLREDAMRGQREWLAAWSGKGLPAAVRIEMKPLAEDRSRLQLSSMTVPVRANRDPYETYADIDPVPQAQ